MANVDQYFVQVSCSFSTILKDGNPIPIFFPVNLHSYFLPYFFQKFLVKWKLWNNKIKKIVTGVYCIINETNCCGRNVLYAIGFPTGLLGIYFFQLSHVYINIHISTCPTDPHQAVACQPPIAYNTDYRNFLEHRHLTWVPPLNPSPTTTWELRELPTLKCSCPSILFYPGAPCVLSLRERCPLCYVWKVRDIEMDYCWSFSNVIMY